MKIRIGDKDLTANVTIEVLAYAEYFYKKRITKLLCIITIIIIYHVSLAHFFHFFGTRECLQQQYYMNNSTFKLHAKEVVCQTITDFW